jgi:hypothetical protein
VAALVYQLPGITVFCFLVSSILKAVVSGILSKFLVVSGTKTEVVPVTPFFPEAEIQPFLKGFLNEELFRSLLQSIRYSLEFL